MTDTTTITKSRSSLLFVVWGLALVLGAAYILSRHAVPLSKLERLWPGITKAEIKKILGEPRQVVNGEWHFWRWGNAGWVQVSFDDHGQLKAVNDESVFP